MKNSETIILQTPIQRGEQTITELTLIRPRKAGQLRGINTTDVAQLHVDTLIKVLPRVTTITETEAADLDPADLVQLGMVIVGFLVPQAQSYLPA